MKKNKYFIVIPLIALLLTACHNNADNGVMTFTVEGTLQNAAGKTLYIEEMTADNGALFRDSIAVDKNGHFTYSGSMDYQTFFNLHSSQYDYIVLLPSDGDNIELTGDFNQFNVTYMVNGSEESRLMWQIQNYINSANVTIADIAEQDRQNQATLSGEDYVKAHKITDSLFINEHQLISQMFVRFIEDNQGSLSTLYAIDAPFNHRARVFYPEQSLDIFELVLDGLMETAPDNPHTQYYRTRVERLKSAVALAQQQQLQEQQQQPPRQRITIE